MFRGVSRQILRAIGVGGARPSTLIAGLAKTTSRPAAARLTAPLATRFFGTAADAHHGAGDMPVPGNQSGPSHISLADLLEREVSLLSFSTSITYHIMNSMYRALASKKCARGKCVTNATYFHVAWGSG